MGFVRRSYDLAPSHRTLSAAIECGKHLIAHAHQTRHGVGWINQNQVQPLAGFAHGSAGIAWALLKLAAMTGQDRFCKTAHAAIAHERTLFSPEAGNWRDLRTSIKGATHSKRNGDYFMSTWCHGAVGIGLARLSTVQQLVDNEIGLEIETALNTTLHCGFGGNHSL